MRRSLQNLFDLLRVELLDTAAGWDLHFVTKTAIELRPFDEGVRFGIADDIATGAAGKTPKK